MSSRCVLIRRLGTLIDVSPDGRSPLPAELVHLLAPQLSYEYKKLLQGADAYTVNGDRIPMRLEPRALFTFEQGRLTTGYGFIPRIAETLRRHGVEVRYLDISPPKPRPSCYEPNWESLLRNFTPRARQLDCLEAIANSYGGIINAAGGFGKSTLFNAICWLYPTAKVAVVVKPQDVAAKLVRKLSHDFPDVGQVGGGKRSYGERITVYTAASSHLADPDTDLLLVDEVHQLASDGLSKKLAEYFRWTRNFGFSACPMARLDGAQARLEMFFGPQIFHLPYQEAQALGLVSPIHVRWLPMQLGHDPGAGKKDVQLMRWGVWRNQARNQAFADDARQRPREQQVLMSVATFDHALHLWQCLPEFELCYASVEEERLADLKDRGALPQSFQRMTAERRDAMRTAFEEGTLKKVIATDVWSTGVDFVQLQVLYRCDARSSEALSTQWPLRTSRVVAGKDSAEIVDSMDLFNKGLHRKANERRSDYKSQGWSEDWPSGGRLRHG